MDETKKQENTEAGEASAEAPTPETQAEPVTETTPAEADNTQTVGKEASSAADNSSPEISNETTPTAESTDNEVTENSSSSEAPTSEEAPAEEKKSKKEKPKKEKKPSDFDAKEMIETIKSFVMVPLHKAGMMYIGIFAGVTLILGLLLGTFFFMLGVILTAWSVYFFRDPARVVPQEEGLIVASADGLVTEVSQNVALPTELDNAETKDTSYTKISVFLSVLDVHVNRVPVAGEIKQIKYNKGKFLNAANDKASSENERSATLIKMADGREIAVVQIAGLVARRIVNELKEGDTVKTGQRLGIIRFGSRVDVYVPANSAVKVIEGQKTVAGETVLADLKSSGELPAGVAE